MKRAFRCPGAGIALAALLSAPAMAEAAGPDAAPASRWSVSAGVLRVEGGEIPARITGGNPAGVAVAGDDDERFGYRFGTAWRWRPGWSVEAAYVGLGHADARVGVGGATDAEILEAAEDLHPQSAHGLAVGILRHWDADGAARVSLGGGAWAWRSEWSVSTSADSRDYHRTGTDLFVTAAVDYRVHERTRLRLRWDRYELEAGEADTFGLELVYTIE